MRALFKIGALIVLIAATVLVAYRLGWFEAATPERIGAARERLRELPAAPLLFVAIYALATTLALPGTVLTLVGGAVFGTLLGTLLNWVGATVGATGAYGLAVLLGRDATRRLLGRRFEKLEQVSTEHGFLGLLRLRLIPIVPFNALNYAAGLAGVRPRDYVAATALGILPATAVYTYFASALVSGAGPARRHAFGNVAIAGGLLVLLSFVPTMARRLGWLKHSSPIGQHRRDLR